MDPLSFYFIKCVCSVYDHVEEEELDGSLNERTESEVERDDKALLYWLTTYSISTSYSYTQTFTLASLVCTPGNYQIDECTG